MKDTTIEDSKSVPPSSGSRHHHDRQAEHQFASSTSTKSCPSTDVEASDERSIRCLFGEKECWALPVMVDQLRFEGYWAYFSPLARSFSALRTKLMMKLETRW